MFVVTTVSVRLLWRRGGQDVDLGWVEYPTGDGVPFETVDGALTPILPDGEAPLPPAQQARARLAEAAAAGIGQSEQPHAPGRTQPRPRPQPGRAPQG